MNFRIPIALVATTVVYFILDLLAHQFTPAPDAATDPDGYLRFLALLNAAVVFAAIFVGSWVARGHFTLPALTLWLLSIGASLIVGYRIQVAAVPVTFLEFATRNWHAITFTLAATLLGVLAGKLIAKAKSSPQLSAT